MNKNIFVILILAIFFASCSDLIDPTIENIRGISTTYVEPNFGYNLVTNGYARIPDRDNFSFNDVATDDAVSNDPSNGFLKMATGQWTASNNAMDRWANSNTAIQYMNIVIDEVNKMKFSEDSAMNKMFKERITGEAYGLRAIHMYYLLQAHAGWVNGKLLGIPLFLKEQTSTSDFNIPRADFNTCMKQINEDMDSATVRLPFDYADITSLAALPARYAKVGVINFSQYNTCMGVKFLGLISGRIIKAYRSKAALLAASPAFADGTANGSSGKWEDAAVLSADIINLKGGVAGLTASFTSGVSWYNNKTEISGLTAGSNPPEVLWRSATYTNNTDEGNNFPPSLFGSGRVNPTQNLVDAFPDKFGYPITDAATVYNSANPYANRDPRLKEFILYHGNTAGVTGAAIDITGTSGTGLDAVNKTQTSTRTGYYMRKLLRQDVNYNPTGRSTQLHYKPRIRYTEIYLDFAEAANEAWGPISDPKGYGYTAYDVIKAIRKRALSLTTDPYLESIKSDQTAMRQLIHNERRLELCFEGFRFYDLRRWKVTLPELTTPAMGINVTGTLASPVYSAPAVVENRSYQSYMYYGPIPYSEILKFSNLLQNDNWNK